MALPESEYRKQWTSYIITCLTRFCLGVVAAMLLYLQAGWTEPRFLAVVCLLLLPAAGTVLLEEKAEFPALFYIGELLLFVTPYLPMAAHFLEGIGISWSGAGTDRFSDSVGIERNSLLLGSLVIVIPSMLSAGGHRRNLLDRPLAVEGILFLTAYLWAIWSEAGYSYRFFLYVLSAVFLLLYFYQKNQYGRHSFFEATGSQVAEGQEEYVRQVNRKSLLPFLLLVLFLSVLVWIPMGSQVLTETVQKSYSGVMDGLNDWLTGIPEDFSGMFGAPQQEETNSDPGLQEREEDLPEIKTVQDELDLWLLKALIQGAMVFLTLLAAGVVFVLLRKMSEKVESKSQNEMQQDYEITVTEKSNRLEPKRRERHPILDHSPENRRIRRIYYEVIRRGLAEREEERKFSGTEFQRKPQGTNYETMAPEELEYQAGVREKRKESVYKKRNQSESTEKVSQKQVSIEVLHKLYEKARYGKEACTKEEQRMVEEVRREL